MPRRNRGACRTREAASNASVKRPVEKAGGQGICLTGAGDAYLAVTAFPRHLGHLRAVPPRSNYSNFPGCPRPAFVNTGRIQTCHCRYHIELRPKVISANKGNEVSERVYQGPAHRPAKRSRCCGYELVVDLQDSTEPPSDRQRGNWPQIPAAPGMVGSPEAPTSTSSAWVEWMLCSYSFQESSSPTSAAGPHQLALIGDACDVNIAFLRPRDGSNDGTPLVALSYPHQSFSQFHTTG